MFHGINRHQGYYTVPIAVENQKYLKCAWRDKRTVSIYLLANGLASPPRIFTKLLQPGFKVLRQKGHLSSSYIDDCYLQRESYGECHANVQDTVSLFQEVEFPIHDEKSVHILCQTLTYLGFILNSITMTVKLTDGRK